MYYFILFICLVIVILNIILFFKIWGMTNDVDRLTHKFCGGKVTTSRDVYYKVAEYMTLGETDKAIEYLNNMLAERHEYLLGRVKRGEISFKQADSYWQNLLASFADVLGKLGAPLPEKYKNFSFVTCQSNYALLVN